ncbi:MAG: hypothetical protein CL534_14815 [Ahrensia sp.]|nr:hypothetical protein [Ahrensia sp.]
MKVLSIVARLLTGLILVGEARGTEILDYSQAIDLDAEELAEGGMVEAYERISRELEKYIPNPAKMEQFIGEGGDRYSVRLLDQHYVIYEPQDVLSDNLWGYATFALFDALNRQLSGSGVKLFALNGGTDLSAIILTEEEAENARKRLKNPREWPYLPTREPPWFGEFH